jgi:hypothetical protein
VPNVKLDRFQFFFLSFFTVDIKYVSPKKHLMINHILLIWDFNLQIIYLKKTPEEAYRPLVGGTNPPFLPFRYL